MRDQFYTILTNIGKAKIANATALNDKISFTKLVVGDGNGNYYEPTEDQIKLKNQVWEGGIGNIQIDKDNPNWIVIETVIPSNVGGFTIREVGVKDIDDNLIVISKYPETYKPKIEDGSTKDLIIKLILEISNAECVTLKVDPTIILATHKDLENIKNELDNKISNIDVSNIEKKTYSELKELKDNKKLKQGSYYILTDYKTRYLQPTTKEIKEGEVEELILLATSTNAFAVQVYSLKYSMDIIYYNFNDNMCEDKKTPRPGFITRRHDTITGNNCPQDWRAMLWARWIPDAKQYYRNEDLVDYEVWTEGGAKLGVIYKADNKLLIAKENTTPKNAIDTSVFVTIYPDINSPLLCENKNTDVYRWTDGSNTLKLKPYEKKDVPTFDKNCARNVIGDTENLHNNVFGVNCIDNTLYENCSSNTFGIECSKNVLSNRVCSNTLTIACRENFLGVGTHNNYFMLGASDNSFGSDCRENILQGDYNHFSNECSYNFIFVSDNNWFGNGCLRNILLYGSSSNYFKNVCRENLLMLDSSDNSFGNKCWNNTLKLSCFYNTFGNACINNTLDSSCISNSFGFDCYGNHFGRNCNKNNFDNGCVSNSFGDYCSYNNFGIDCRNNKLKERCNFNYFLNNCGYVTFNSGLVKVFVENLYSKDVTNLDIYNKNYTITFARNKNGDYIYWFLDENNTPVYKQIP